MLPIVLELLFAVSLVITEVCRAVPKCLGPKFISLPKNKDEVRVRVSEFEAKFGMKQTLGFIDGTHISIKCQAQNS